MHVRELAAAAVAAGHDTQWFEQLYQAADRGEANVPWADLEPNPLLVDQIPPSGGKVLVVGCGYGDDAAHLASLGRQVTAFDISATAVATARQRFGDSGVRFTVADALAPPKEWSFDLVVEIYTVQTLLGPARDRATTGIAECVAPGGELLVIARARPAGEPEDPRLWDLTRTEIEAFAHNGLTTVEIEGLNDGESPPVPRWRARFRRPATDA